jgi:voltage-gated potassium channel
MTSGEPDGRSLKRRIYDVLEVNGVDDWAGILIDRILVLLVICNLTSVILETVPDLAARYEHLFLAIEIGSVLVFAGEYALRVWIADLHPPLAKYAPWSARLHFMMQPHSIIDFLSFAPTAIGFVAGLSDLNVLVVFRLLRFLKLARYSPGMRSLMSAISSERRALIASAVLMMGLIVTMATLMYLLERHIQPDRFGSIPQAMYWAVTTLTTVGYGDVVPVTAPGKVLAGVAMLAGLCMFALPVGIIATAFAREIHNRDFVVTWSMVARVPIFQHLNASEIAEVTRLLRAQTVEPGTVVTHKGDPAFAMYFIASGAVEVDVPSGPVRLGEGAFFGEMAVLRKTRRTADVVALTACRLLVLEAADLHILMSKKTKIGEHIRSVAEARRVSGAASQQGDLVREELKDPLSPDALRDQML